MEKNRDMEKAAITKEKKRQILVFNLAGDTLGVDVLRVYEVLRGQEIHPLPQGPVFVEGVINLRKHIIAVIDLRKKFGVETGTKDMKTRIIICKIRGFIVGIVVDSVRDVITLDDSEIEPIPAVVTRDVKGSCIAGVARNGDELIAILDMENILTDEETETLSGA